MKRTFRLFATTAALLASVAIGAGCGSDEQSNDYVDEVNALQLELVAEVTEIVSGAPPTDSEALTRVAGDLREVFETKAEEIEAVEPPAEVADLHERLVSAIRDVGDQIGEARKAFASDNPRQAARAALELQTATAGAQTDLDGLIDEINAKLLE